MLCRQRSRACVRSSWLSHRMKGGPRPLVLVLQTARDRRPFVSALAVAPTFFLAFRTPILVPRLFEILRELFDALRERHLLDPLQAIDLAEAGEQHTDLEPRFLARSEMIALVDLRVGPPSVGSLFVGVVLLPKLTV